MCTEDKFANVDDIDEGYILLVPAIGTALSLIMVLFLAFQRVLNKPRCSEEELKELENDKKYLKEHSQKLEDSPQDKLEAEKKVANHILTIADNIQEGAEAFLTTEYKFMSIFVILMLVIVGFATDEWEDTVPSFVIGAAFSAICGWIGMSIAVRANVRTATAAQDGLNAALAVAFSSGAVMGLGVTGMGMLGLIIIYGAWGGVAASETRYLAGFGFGASAIALFARVGGGIYTKAADVGADLVGKVEKDIPEDDPRNPATIADNVGDNVGDVAGMGADLFESFVGSIIASIQLAPSQALYWADGCQPTDNDIRALIAVPFWIAGFGMCAACVGIFFVRTGDDNADENELQHRLLNTIFYAIIGTGVIALGLALLTVALIIDLGKTEAIRIWVCTLIGLVAGIFIGQFTEYVTSFSYKPTRTIAKKARFGEAGVIIQGLGIGMLSTFFPVGVLFVTILACDELAGTYGVGIAAVGMLSTLGVTLATDAFGPVADNAGGIAEMADLPKQIRDRTDALDALGNTTAATGKGFAIGSAVLTSLALLTAYKNDAGIGQVDVTKAAVLSSAIVGACLPYIFASLTMMAVGRAATMMIAEVRTQFEERNLLGTSDKPVGQPDFRACVDISTKASLVEMIIPGTLAVTAPLMIGFLLGAEALGGLLVGGITSGFMLAVYMANAGGAWDNAKKWIEAGGLKHPNRGKGSKYHKAAVVGDTIGDPFKDTSGPALNILIKLMTMISLVFAKNVFKNKGEFDNDSPWWVGAIITGVFILGAGSLTKYLRDQGFGKIGDDQKEEVEVQEDFKSNVGFSV